ncbi:hypothetical protein ACOSP7_002712 [Xanthoceras sorbifolium]
MKLVTRRSRQCGVLQGKGFGLEEVTESTRFSRSEQNRSYVSKSQSFPGEKGRSGGPTTQWSLSGTTRSQ